MAVGGEHLAQRLDGGALAGTRHTGDAETHALATVGQTAFYHLLGLLLVGVEGALDEGDGTAQQGSVAMQDAAYQLLGGGSLPPPGAHSLYIAVVDLLRLLDTLLHTQRGVIFEIAVKMLVVHSI